MKPHTRALPRAILTGSTVEILESRIAPATLSSPGIFSYTDGDGEVVKVNVSGTFASVDFLNDLGEDVVTSGGDVASVVIANPGANFAITVAAAEVSGDGIITLGNITGVSGARLPVIKGVFTVPSADDSVTYELAGFRGTGFSTDGGVSVIGRLVGGSAEGAGFDVTKVAAKTTVIFTDGIAADATAVVGNLTPDGKVNVGGTLDGTLTVATVGGKLLMNEVGGSVFIQKGVSGRVLADSVPGLIEIQGEVSIFGRISSTADLNLRVVGGLRGSVQVVGDLTLEVGENMTAAEVLVGANLTLDVGGSILKSRINAQEQFFSNTGVRNDIVQSSLVGGNGMDLQIGRNVKGSRLSSGLDNMELEIGGTVTGSELFGGDDMELAVGGNVTSSRILPDGQLVANLQRDLSKTLIGSQSSSAIVNVGGKVMASQLIAGEDAELNSTGDVNGLDATIGANATLTASANATKARFSVGEELQVNVTGNLIDSVLLPANTLIVEVQKNIQGSALASFDNSTFITVGGTMKGTRVDSGESVTVTAVSVGTGSQLRAAADVNVTASSKVEGFIIASGDVSVSTTGLFAGTVSAGQNLSLTADSVNIANNLGFLTGGAKGIAELPSGLGIGTFRGLRVGGDFALSVTNDYKAPSAIIGGNVTDFHVGNDFTGFLRIVGDFVPGDTTESVTLIGGAVSKTSVLSVSGNMGSDTSAPKLVFAGAFPGQLLVDGKLMTDLEFSAGATRLAFEGGIGPAALGDNIVNIIVTGTLSSLSSASLFKRTDATSGSFVDGEGTVTGLISATGSLGNVTPEDFTAPVPI